MWIFRNLLVKAEGEGQIFFFQIKKKNNILITLHMNFNSQEQILGYF